MCVPAYEGLCLYVFGGRTFDIYKTGIGVQCMYITIVGLCGSVERRRFKKCGFYM